MPDLRPFGPLPPGRQSDAGFDTLMDYYLSFNDAFVRVLLAAAAIPH
jgi:hypothetical protein